MRRRDLFKLGGAASAGVIAGFAADSETPVKSAAEKVLDYYDQTFPPRPLDYGSSPGSDCSIFVGSILFNQMLPLVASRPIGNIRMKERARNEAILQWKQDKSIPYRNAEIFLDESLTGMEYKMSFHGMTTREITE
jgi:hypothetical protein